MHDVTLIVPQRNRADLTLDCLRTLRTHHPTLPPIIVVDDGSERAQRSRIRSAHLPNVSVIANPPRGVSAAWNTGCAAATTRYVILLNNDVLTTGSWIDAMVAPLRSDRCRMTGLHWRTERQLPASLLQTLPAKSCLAGWCLAFHRSTWSSLLGFDERMKLYWSDFDFQLRLLRQFQHLPSPLRALPELPLEHLGHGTAGHLPSRREQWHHDRDIFRQLWNPSP